MGKLFGIYTGDEASLEYSEDEYSSAKEALQLRVLSAIVMVTPKAKLWMKEGVLKGESLVRGFHNRRVEESSLLPPGYTPAVVRVDATN